MSSSIIKSVNRGENWEEVLELPEDSIPAIVQDFSGQLIVVYFEDDTLKWTASVNLGADWTDSEDIDLGAITPSAGILGIDYDSSDTLYLMFWDNGDTFYVLKTPDLFTTVTVSEVEVEE